MRPKYSTRAIVLARYPAGEASATISLLTPEFGLVRARVQGIRKPGAKLAPALQTFTECEAMLVRGKDGWRLSGAVLAENWFRKLPVTARARAGRVGSLILRLVHGETADAALYSAFSEFLAALPHLSEQAHDAAELLAALRIVRALGLDAGEMADVEYEEESLARLIVGKKSIVERINRGLSASGL